MILVGLLVTHHLDSAKWEKTMASLKRERDMAWKNLASRDSEIKGLKQRLRSLEDMLRQSEGRLANFKETVKKLEDDPVDTEKQMNELDRWLSKVVQLRNFIKHHPEYAIPEFKYLTDQDWLAATEGRMETVADYRGALAVLRQRALLPARTILKQAVDDFARANNGISPRNYADIIRYLPEDFDTSRYTDCPSGASPSVNPTIKSQPWIIKDVGPVDTIWDSGIWISAKGNSATTQIDYVAGYSVAAAIKEYEKINGRAPLNSSQIYPYIKSAEKISKTDVEEIYRCIMTPVQ